MSVKTDLSQWHKINSSLKIFPTQKKYYDRFVHKLVYRSVYRAGVVTSIRHEDEIMPRLLALTGRDSFAGKGDPYQVSAASEKLISLFRVYQTRGENLRIRIESSSVSLFANDLEYLHKIATNDLSCYQNHLEFLTTVLDDQQQQYLDNNLIIVKEATDYTHRVSVRDGFYPNSQERQALADYLETLGSEVRCTKRFINSIRSSNKYIQIGYFYVRDPRIIDMIRLIIPNLVRRVDQVVVS